VNARDDRTSAAKRVEWLLWFALLIVVTVLKSNCPSGFSPP
jgi:hypothetical protein